MLIQRSNPRLVNTATGKVSEPINSADASFAAMQRHHGRKPPGPPVEPPQPTSDKGDILYGGQAIAAHLFPGEDPDRARRRVFHLWAHYRERKERAGFFKLKGAVCLSKSQWLTFHGLD